VWRNSLGLRSGEANGNLPPPFVGHGVLPRICHRKNPVAASEIRITSRPIRSVRSRVNFIVHPDQFVAMPAVIANVHLLNDIWVYRRLSPKLYAFWT
jgi:hypothetical protein